MPSAAAASLHMVSSANHDKHQFRRALASRGPMPRCVCFLDVIHDLVEAKLQHPPLPAKPVFEATGRATSRRLWGACGNNPCFVSQTSPCEGLRPALVFGYVLGMKNPQRGAGGFGGVLKSGSSVTPGLWYDNPYRSPLGTAHPFPFFFLTKSM